MRHYGKEKISYLPPILLFVFAALVLLGYGVYRFVVGIQFDREISGYLKLAADSNQPEMAAEQIRVALESMSRRGICNEVADEPPDMVELPEVKCYTSVLYTTPNENIAFWRRNIQKTLVDLEALPPDADHLTRSNTLMKVRETLLDGGQRGDYVTEPEGLSVYGHNKKCFLIGWGSLMLAVLAVFWFVFRARANGD